MNTLSIKYLFLLLSILIISKESLAQGKVQIMLVGFDHLSQLYEETGNDSIFSEKKQQEILELTHKLKNFSPDMIMVELDPKEQALADSLYVQYTSGEKKLSDFEYGAGETYQVGFRLAKQLNLPKVYAVDHYESTSQALLNKGDNIELFKKQLKKLQYTARPLQTEVKENKLSIYEYIKKINEPEMIDLTHHLLFNLPAYVVRGEFSENGSYDKNIPIDKNYIGASYISLFYTRNLKIYSNILNAQLHTKKQKLLLIMGQAHIGVLQDLIEENPNYEIISPQLYFN